jgi:hypothetical protein
MNFTTFSSGLSRTENCSQEVWKEALEWHDKFWESYFILKGKIAYSVSPGTSERDTHGERQTEREKERKGERKLKDCTRTDSSL